MRRTATFGAELVGDGVRFRLWAPNQEAVSLILDGGQTHPMPHVGNGRFEIERPDAKASTLYQFALADGLKVPDPASRYQPSDVHGPSEVVDPQSYQWNDVSWCGRPWEECVLYELHIGAFTPEGTFSAATDRLEWLAGMGITAVEVMPVADFPGRSKLGI
jgi:maltooligosyltrehalose trehalohydrolase